MSKACKYCGQSNTQKDAYGYCRKHSCFERSGRKAEVEKLEKKISDAKYGPNRLPTYKRNYFDGTPYNPQEQKIAWLRRQQAEIINF